MVKFRLCEVVMLGLLLKFFKGLRINGDVIWMLVWGFILL